jgi:hypothetical protein
MTTTHPSANDSGLNLDHLEALARAATPGPWAYQEESDAYTHIVRPTHTPGRIVRQYAQDTNGVVEANARFTAGANPAAVLGLIALARRAALANQPAPTVPTMNAKELGEAKLFNDFINPDVDDLAAALAHQPAQEQAEPTMRKCSKFGHRCNCATDCDPTQPHPSMATQQEPVASPQQAAAPGEWKRLDMDDKPDASRWIDVVLDNGVTEYSRTYALIDWTAVRDWRYSAPGTPEAPAAAEKLYASWQHSQPDRCNIPPWRLLAESVKIEWEQRAAAQLDTAPEAPKKPAHGHRDDYYLPAIGRRLGLEPISRVRNMPNWVLAMELFATGSGSAYQICRDAGIDPEGTTIQRAAQLDGGQEGSGK